MTRAFAGFRWKNAVQRVVGGSRDIHGNRWLWVSACIYGHLLAELLHLSVQTLMSRTPGAVSISASRPGKICPVGEGTCLTSAPMCRRPLQRNLAEHLLWLAKDRAHAVPNLAKLHTLSWKVHSALEEVMSPL